MKTHLFIDGTWRPRRSGREGGHDGLLEFMEKKYVAVEW